MGTIIFAQNQPLDYVRGLVIDARQRVGIDVHGRGHGGVPEYGLSNFGVDPGCQGQGGKESRLRGTKNCTTNSGEVPKPNQYV